MSAHFLVFHPISEVFMKNEILKKCSLHRQVISFNGAFESYFHPYLIDLAYIAN